MSNKHILTKLGVSFVSMLTLSPMLLTSASANENVNSTSTDNNNPSTSTSTSADTISSDDVATPGEYSLDAYGSYIGSNTYMSPYIKKHFYDNLSPANKAAKYYVARVESSSAYDSYNGDHYGKFQLLPQYLKWGKSKIGQEKAADAYVKSRYGSWVNAKKHELNYNWMSVNQ
ncbi:hypothetical protein DY052_06210 [Apilactobacillus timberlakei]|uniref:aggregation-promoting factor C-terminal-like domain-containing protein n=1 Tax=Apilactobacillus timberlakei TaxID=2008380 RepID=UPI00112C1A3D|nr:hypothetical protein [Apilactobacillus timberlakei]TPR15017.1 hypothetical protein DY052_06210 [Apilactobacillus timberlakei]